MRFGSLALFVATLAMIGPALAAEWAIEPSVASRLERNDNWRLSATNQQAVTTLSVAPSARFSSSTEISSLLFEIGAIGYKAFGDDALTRLDGNLLFGARTRTERAAYNIDTRFIRDSTLATELRETGLVTDRVQRNLFGLQGGYKYALTQRLSAVANSGAQVARYDTTVTNGLRDFNTYSLGGGLEYLLTERTAFNSQLGWSRFTTVPYVNRANTFSWNNVLDHRFSETFKGSAAVGVARVNTEVQEVTGCIVRIGTVLSSFPNSFCSANGLPLSTVRSAIDESNTTRLFAAGLDWQYSPVSSWNAGARQEVLPSGTGTVVKVLSIFSGLNHSFTEKLRGGADIRYTDANFFGGSTVGVDSRTLFFGAQLIYQMTREWSFESGARRIQVSYTNASANADANIVYGQVKYEWPRLSVAR